jgi:hypothetical protein
MTVSVRCMQIGVTNSAKPMIPTIIQ